MALSRGLPERAMYCPDEPGSHDWQDASVGYPLAGKLDAHSASNWGFSAPQASLEVLPEAPRRPPRKYPAPACEVAKALDSQHSQIQQLQQRLRRLQDPPRSPRSNHLTSPNSELSMFLDRVVARMDDLDTQLQQSIPPRAQAATHVASSPNRVGPGELGLVSNNIAPHVPHGEPFYPHIQRPTSPPPVPTRLLKPEQQQNLRRAKSSDGFRNRQRIEIPSFLTEPHHNRHESYTPGSSSSSGNTRSCILHQPEVLRQGHTRHSEEKVHVNLWAQSPTASMLPHNSCTPPISDTVSPESCLFGNAVLPPSMPRCAPTCYPPSPRPPSEANLDSASHGAISGPMVQRDAMVMKAPFGGAPLLLSMESQSRPAGTASTSASSTPLSTANLRPPISVGARCRLLSSNPCSMRYGSAGSVSSTTSASAYTEQEDANAGRGLTPIGGLNFRVNSLLANGLAPAPQHPLLSASQQYSLSSSLTDCWSPEESSFGDVGWKAPQPRDILTSASNAAIHADESHTYGTGSCERRGSRERGWARLPRDTPRGDRALPSTPSSLTPGASRSSSMPRSFGNSHESSEYQFLSGTPTGVNRSGDAIRDLLEPQRQFPMGTPRSNSVHRKPVYEHVVAGPSAGRVRPPSAPPGFRWPERVQQMPPGRPQCAVHLTPSPSAYGDGWEASISGDCGSHSWPQSFRTSAPSESIVLDTAVWGK